MKSIYANLVLIGYLVNTQYFKTVTAASAPFPGPRPCYENEQFLEDLTARAVRTPSSSIYDRLLHLHYHARFLSGKVGICKALARRMRSLRDEFYNLFERRSHALTGPFVDPLTIEQFEGVVSGYLVAMSGHFRGPFATSQNGFGKLKTMSVVDYVVTGNTADMSRLLSGGEIRLVDSLLRFFTVLLEESELAGIRVSREEPPTTPTYRVRQGGSSAPSPHRYLPGNDQWYELLYGVISNLLTWEDAELIDLYRSVVESLLSSGLADPSSRSSIYRSLMFVNQQLYLDRTIGLATNDVNHFIKRITTYKRILSRLIAEENGSPFVFSFEQLKMIDLYESFVKSRIYESATDFAYKDSLKRSLLLNGVLFSLEFDSPKSLIVNIVGSVLKDLVAEFPSQGTPAARRFASILREVNLMRGRSDVDFEQVETSMLVHLEGGAWTTPVEIGYEHLNAEYCAGLTTCTALCETMVSLLGRQMRANQFNWFLDSTQLMVPLQKVNKRILYRIRHCDRGTEELVNALESLWDNIERKFDESEHPDLTDEKRFLHSLLESPPVIVTQPMPAESQPVSPRKNPKGKKKGKGKGR